MKQPERYVEPRLTQYLFDRASRTLTPLSGTFELSPVCNLACKMCYVRKTPAEVAASPRPPVGLIQWLSIAEQARDAGMLYLLLTGGEPFLWQDFWPLYERLSTMGFLISINSNGTLLDEARVARLAEHPPTRINITLYGAGNETTKPCAAAAVCLTAWTAPSPCCGRQASSSSSTAPSRRTTRAIWSAS